MEGTWELQAESPSLPARVIYLNDGIRHIISPARVRLTVPYPPPFNSGFTNAEYRVHATTNVDSFRIPAQFVFTRYYAQGNRLFVRTLTQAKVDRAQVGADPFESRPVFTGKAITVDKRFRTADEPVPAVPYWVTNGAWPDPNTLTNAYRKQLIKYTAAKRFASSHSGRIAFRRFVILGVLSGLVVLPAACIAFRIVRKNRNEKNTTKEE